MNNSILFSPPPLSFLLAAAGLTLACSAEYRYENAFDVKDEAGHAYGIDVVALASYSHGFGVVDEAGYRILIPGAKHFLETPKLADFRLETDVAITRHRQEFDIGIKVLYRWDRAADCGHELKFYWNAKSLFRIESEGEVVFSRQDEKLPEMKGWFVLEVAGTQAKGSFLGQDFAFDVPAGAAGFVALDTTFAPGAQAAFRQVLLTSSDAPKRTCVRDWRIALKTTQGFQEPLQYDICEYRWETGETEFTARLSGTIMDRGPRIQSSGTEWCSILERLTTPYLRFESDGREIRNCLFFNGCRTFFDRQLCAENWRCTADALPKFPWPIERSWVFRSFPTNFTIAAGYEYAMAQPWRFAENGPWERIVGMDGQTVYEGGSLRKGLSAIEIRPTADEKIVARVPEGVTNRTKAVWHAANCGYFSESTVPSFAVAFAMRADDFELSELKYAAELTTVFGDKVADVVVSRAGKEMVGYDFRRVTVTLASSGKLPVGVYHLNVDWSVGLGKARETYVFEVLSETPGAACPPVASGLPKLVSQPTEIKYLESAPLDPWADFGGMGHYYAFDERYPYVGLQQGVDRFFPLYGRKWWTCANERNGGPQDSDSEAFRDLVRRIAILGGGKGSRAPNDRYAFEIQSFYRGHQLAILRDYVAEKKPPLKLLTLENLDRHVAADKPLSKDEVKELFDTCWEDFLAYARPRVEQRVQGWADYLLGINPKLALASYGPYSVYVSHYKSPYALRYHQIPMEHDPRLRANGSFFLLEDYHFSCDYPLTRPAYFVSGYALHCPDSRHLYPEIYYSAWTHCNDGAVYQAHPGVKGDAPLADTHQRRIVYQYCYGTPHLKDGRWDYWRDYGFHARNPEKAAMDEMMYAWGKMLKNKPAKPLKAPYVVQDLAEIARHGDYWEDEANYLIKGRDYEYTQSTVNNSAEEDLGYTYEECSFAGYNTPVLTTYADLDGLTRENCEFAVLPPVVKGTPKEVLAKIRAAHARGVNLLCFESAEGLEDLFGVKPVAPRKLGCVAGEVFSHKLAVSRHASDGAEVVLFGAAKAGAAADIPVLFTHKTATGRTAFFAVPPTMVGRSTMRTNFAWGQETVSKAMRSAERAAFAFLAPTPSVRSERGEVSAVVTEKGDIAVVVNESTSIYGDATKYPASCRLTVSAPGIGRMKPDADAPFDVISRTDDSVTLRTETMNDTGNFFTFGRRSK